MYLYRYTHVCIFHDASHHASSQNGIGHGVVLTSNIYLSTAILHLARERAGCLDENEKVIPACDGEAYGFKPGNFISNMAVLASILSALSMPVVGAMIDFSERRKIMGVALSVSIIVIQLIQIGTVTTTLLATTLLHGINGCLLQKLTMVTYAYLPE